MENNLFAGLVGNNISVADKFWKWGRIEKGEKLIDPLLFWGCSTLGYDRNDIIDYVFENIKKYKNEGASQPSLKSDKIYLNDFSFKLAEKLYNMSDGFKTIFTLSGSSANEGAIKLSSAYHYLKKNFKKNKILHIKDSYHGSTFLLQNITGTLFDENVLYTQKPYDGVLSVDRDFKIEDLNFDDVMCIIVEPCSYSGEMTPYTKEFWEKLKLIRSQYDVLIVIDDIFTGGGKTGDYFGWKNLPIKPSIFTMSKAITNGHFPISFCCYDKKIDQIIPDDFDWQFGFTHSFTVPGQLAALKYISILEDEKILENHNFIKNRAIEIFKKKSKKIINSFGLIFNIDYTRPRASNNPLQHLIQIPITADDEYFSLLEKQI